MDKNLNVNRIPIVQHDTSKNKPKKGGVSKHEKG